MRQENKIYPGFWLLLFTLCLLLVGSSDGWFHFQVHRADTAWFLMGGKSWMAGLTPYVDFTDSKGPLLWLFYGLGYLMSPHNFYGVFLIEVLFYWLTFFTLYKTVLLITGKSPLSILASMAMGLLFFAPGLHQETLTEDYCHLFNAVTFYILVRIIVKGENRDWFGVLTGLCCGAALMMKYSYFLTLLAPAFVIFIYLVSKGGNNWWRFLLWSIGGMAAIVVPFIVYFLWVGAFDAFIQEYFINTFSTIQTIGGDEDAPSGFLPLFFSRSLVSAFIWLITIGLGCTLYLFRRERWMVCALAIWFIVSIIPCCMVSQAHLNYFLYPCIFALGGIIWLVSLFRRLNFAGAIIGGAVIIAMLAWSGAFIKYSEFYHIDREQRSKEAMERVAEVINDRQRQTGKRPTLSYYNASERGEHILTDAVAGTRYWSLQAGMTPSMLKDHESELFAKKPDFIIVEGRQKELRKKLEEAGYEPRIEYAPWGYEDGQEPEVYVLFEKI